MSRIIVKNLPDKVKKEKLFEIFSEKGVVTDVQLKFTKDGKFRKFAFIGFQKPESAEAAIKSLNNSFINTSKIQIEECLELGNPNKPRAWSKHTPENSAVKRLPEKLKDEVHEAKKPKTSEKEKIKDPEVKELLKKHEKDALFNEFLDLTAPDFKLPISEKEENGKRPESTEESSEEDKEEEEEDKANTNPANQDISDSQYLKLKTGTDIKLSAISEDTNKSERKEHSFEIFTVKLNGLPHKITKSKIKEFLNPAKPFTIRKPAKIKGIAYCGFKREKDMKLALLKHRSFLNGKRISVSAQKKTTCNNETEEKWKKENLKLENSETIAESGSIFVRNLPYTASEDDLKPLFEKYGPIAEFTLPIDSFTRKPKGFGIVTFVIPEHACRAFNELDGTIFQGRMLHLLPALAKTTTEEDEEGLGFKERKLKKEKSKAGSSMNWNTFFIGENTLAEAMAATYNTTKENVLDDTQNGAAVRLALGETQIISQMKEFLEENDVSLDAFQNMSICPRSKTVILVKNLPFGTKSEEIREKFSPCGQLKRVVLPPHGVAALVEFVETSEAKAAFKRMAYAKFKHVPLYLEWAPEKIFSNERKTENKSQEGSDKKKDTAEEKKEPEENVNNKDENNLHYIPLEGTTIFVKNLNFSTEEEALRKHFSKCGNIVSVTIGQKKDPSNPRKKLSTGYGFVQFATTEAADKALKQMQFTTLDDHKIELKRSHRTIASDEFSGRKTSQNKEKPSSKILVRNIPFQATRKEIYELFKVFGEIKAVRLPKKMVGTGSHRGFCFVEYNVIHDAKRAFKALCQSTHLYGRRLVLEWAATDDDVDTLREKTAQQYSAGISANAQKKKNITIEEGESSSEE